MSALPELLARLRVLHLSAPSSADVLAVTTFCEEFKRRPDALDSAVHILSNHVPEHGPVARHFAYQVLQHAISLNWATLDPAVKTNFKTVAIHCMSSWALDLEAEERFVKAAAVQFVARLMLLEWPQRWVECTDTLLSIAAAGDTQQELVAKVLQAVAEEASSSDLASSISAQQQSDVMQGLQTTALDLLTRFRDLLQSQVAAFQSKGPRSGRHLTICKAVMDLFGAYAPWLLPSTLLSLGVIPMLIALLRLPELAAEACFVLSCLSTRKYAKVDGEFKSLLLRHIPPAVCEVLAAPSAELFQNVQSVMAVTLVGIVDSLLAWACSEISVHARLAQEMLTALTAGMMAVFRFPSLTTASEVLSQLKRMLDAIPDFPSLRGVLQPHMPEIMQSACVVFALDASFLYDAGDSARQAFLEQEFDDISEYRQFAMQTRDRASQFLRAAAPQFPLEATQAVDALVQRCAALIGAAAPTSSMKSQAFLHAQAMLANVEALALPLQTVVESSLDEELRRAMTPTLARSLMVLIRAISLDAPAFASVLLVSVGSFHTVLAMDTEGFKTVLGQLTWALSFQLPRVPGIPSHEQVDSIVRRGARTSLFQLAKHAGLRLLAAKPDIVQCIRAVMDVPGCPLGERSELLETVVLLVNALPNPAEQQAFAEGILKPCCEMLASESVMSALMTSRSFVECLLADAPLDTPGAADSRKSFARELQSALFTVHAVANRFKIGASHDSSPVLRDKWSVLLPVLFRLLCVIHGMMEPASKLELCKAVDSNWAYVVSTEESLFYLGHGGNQLYPEGLSPSASRWFVVSNWFFKLRQSAGTIVAIAISHGNLGMFQPSCLPGLSVLELGLLGREPMSYLSCREIPSLCKHILVPLVKKCPSTLWSACLSRLVAPFLEHAAKTIGGLLSRPVLDASLETALSAAGHAALDDPLFLGVDFLTRSGVAVEMLDQLKEKILRDSMSYVMDVVAALTEIHISPQVAAPPPFAAQKSSSLKKGSRGSKAVPPSDSVTASVLSATSHIGCFTFLGDAAFTSCFVSCMTCVANWNDSVSFRRWTSMWLRVFKLLASAPQLADMFAGTVFKLSTEALLMQKPWTLDSRLDLLSLVTDLYHHFVVGMKVTGPRELLLTLPCVRRDRLTALEKQMGSLSEKKRKQLFKDFLQDIIVELSTGGSGSDAVKAKKVVVKGTSALKALKNSAAKEDHVSTAGLYGDEWDEL